MNKNDLLPAATGALIVFAIAVLGFGRGLSMAWPWAVAGALGGLFASMVWRNLRGPPEAP